MWKIIRINFTSAEDLVPNAFQIVKHLENEHGLKELYFAHYNDELGPRIQISVESSVLDDARVEKVVKQYKCVTNWTINDRNPDPFPHAYALAFSICKVLLHLDKTKKIDELYELFHWVHNMLGFSYGDEADNYSNWSQRLRRGI